MTNVNRITSVDNANNYNTQKVNSDSTSDFSSYLGETKSLDEIFDNAAEKYNVPVELLKAIGKAESNFDTDAVSRCGAQGVMQLMPATAKGLGVTNAFDPEQNIMAGAKYISGLMKKYDGNTSLALAAYNAGSGNVAKYNGIPPFEETQNYVKKVLNYIGQGKIETASAKISSANSSLVNSKSMASNILHVASAPTPIRNNLSYLLTNSTSSIGDSFNDLETLFSYDDYLKFLDMFLEEEKEEDTNENSANYNSKDINYNAAVLNLINNQKII
ncbi:MAG: lytic transglycosylase domain-containing protein [Herbinix sp.]|nr:lytic transglycosylase domain-containing protein [Herbinix sp.]